MKNKKDSDPFNEVDWNEKPNSIFSLGIILDEIQDGTITDKVIQDYINVKSDVSSKNDSVKELFFLKNHIPLLASKVKTFVYQRLYELNKKDISPKDNDAIINIDKDLLTYIEVSKIIGISRQQVYDYVKKGKLRSYQLG